MPKNTDIEKKQEDEGADEDIVVDESSPDFQSLLKKLKHDLKECHSERTEYLAGWQRAKADYINQKSEFEKQKQEIVRYAKEDLFHEMFDLADSFEMLSPIKKLGRAFLPTGVSGWSTSTISSRLFSKETV